MVFAIILTMFGISSFFNCSGIIDTNTVDVMTDTNNLDVVIEDYGDKTDLGLDVMAEDQGEEIGTSDTEITEDISIADVGTKPPVYLGFFVHLEGWPNTEEAQRDYFKKIRDYEKIFSNHGAKLTLESKELAQNILKYGDNVLAELEKKGHTIGSHADIGTEIFFTKDSFISSLIAKKTELEKIGTHPRHVSGVCSWLDWSNFVAEAGFSFVTSSVQYCLKSLPPQNQPDTVKNCLNPSDCHAPYPLELRDRLHPWRMSSNDWTKADPEGKVVNIPSSSLLPCLAESKTNPNVTQCPFDDNDIKEFFSELDEVISLADNSQITMFMVGWSFGEPIDPILLEKWLTQIDSYVASGKVVWKTAGEIYDEFLIWEKNGGISTGPGDGVLEGKLDNASKINFVLEIHSGEGDDPSKNCMMDGNTTLTTAKYTICRDGMKDITKSFTDGTLKTPNYIPINLKSVIELHPRFLDLLALDEESGKGLFSFTNNMISDGHQIGVHNHYECHTSAVGGDKCLSAVNNWGEAFQTLDQKKKPGFAFWEVRITTYDYLIDTLHKTLLSNIVFDPISIWGTDYLITINSDMTVEKMVDAGYTVMTSHGMFSTKYDKGSNPECYMAEAPNDLNRALIHKLIVKNSAETKSIIYYDNRPASFGESDFDNSDLLNAFESAIKCMKEEKSPDNPYVFVVATHLHNIIANTSTKYKWKGIEDIQNTITLMHNIAGKYSKKIEYTTFDSLK